MLKLFSADFGFQSIGDELKIIGKVVAPQELQAMLEYLRSRCITNITASVNIADEFPDLQYILGFRHIAGFLLIPLSSNGKDSIAFFRKPQQKEVTWARIPDEQLIKRGTESGLEQRQSFKPWTETVVGTCQKWSEAQIETVAVLCTVHGKLAEAWRRNDTKLQNCRVTRLLLSDLGLC